MDLGKIQDLDESIHAAIEMMNSDRIDEALAECEAARENWLAPKPE